MKSVLILGAGGFIGAYLTEALARHKDFVLTAVDISREKLDDLDIPFVYRSLDLTTDKEVIRELICQHDVVVNLIAIANPGIYVKDPLATFKLDFIENLWIVEQCVEAKKRLIQFSTSEVYGKSPAIFTPRHGLLCQKV